MRKSFSPPYILSQVQDTTKHSFGDMEEEQHEDSLTLLKYLCEVYMLGVV